MRTIGLFLIAFVALLPPTTLAGTAAQVQFGGFGEHSVDRSVPCLTDEQRVEIQSRISSSIRSLRRRGLLPEKGAHVTFGWPARLRSDLTDPGFHGVSNFVDHSVPAGSIQDYLCGTRSYDQTGYNHQGTDIFTWPFGWYKMDHDDVEIIAAAAGTIVYRADGNYDRNCGFGSGDWNAVFVQHADGSIAWYGHMKSGSLTPKQIGETVAKGEYLGVIGSSGNSTGPHLHFEVYDASNALIDPYEGPCNPSTTSSWWDSQPPYYDSAINAVLTHDAPPAFPSCPQTETPNQSIFFHTGQTAYFAAYYRDQLAGQLSHYAVYDASGNTVVSWDHSSPAPHYVASYWYWYFQLPAGGSLGWWRFEVTFQGNTYQKLFFVADPADVSEGPLAGGLRFAGGTPNPASAGTTFDFELPNRGPVSLVLLDGQGRRVTTLAEREFEPGRHSVTWDGRDADGRRVAPGLYFARLYSAAGAASRKVVVTE